jgi:hypothetical protein
MQESLFYYWQKKINKNKSNKVDFVPLVIDNTLPRAELPAISKRSRSFPAPSIPAQGLICEISYPDGTTVKLSGYGDSDFLSSLAMLKR